MNWLICEKCWIDHFIVNVKEGNSAKVIDHEDLIVNRKLQMKFG